MCFSAVVEVRCVLLCCGGSQVCASLLWWKSSVCFSTVVEVKYVLLCCGGSQVCASLLWWKSSVFFSVVVEVKCVLLCCGGSQLLFKGTSLGMMYLLSPTVSSVHNTAHIKDTRLRFFASVNTHMVHLK